jgi:micrococcal nuclease
MIVLRLLAVLATLQVVMIGYALAQPTYVPGVVMWVIDGDTYRIRYDGMPQGESVRARHFDTAEKGDRAQCQEEAQKALQGSELARRLLPNGSVVLLSNFGRDRYGRLLATVTLTDGRDLATVMIDSGLAHPYEGGRKRGWCSPEGAIR